MVDLKKIENLILPCIQDFEAFIKYIEEEKPTLSPRKGVLGKKDSFQVSSRLNYKREVTAPHYEQKNYFVIDLMFSLAIDSTIFLVVNDEKGKAYLDKTERAESFLKLNNFEKYIFLLEAYWSKYDFDEKLPRWMGGIATYNMLSSIAKGKPGEPILKEYTTQTLFAETSYFLHHLHFFGLCSVTLIDEVKDRYEDSVKAVIPNEFGIMVCRQLIEKAVSFWNKEDVETLMENISVKKTNKENKKLFSILAEIFPNNIVQNTVENEAPIDKGGVYTFKVSLSKTIWRKILMSHKNTFEDLHLAIQEAFDFDNDHLYEFYIGGSRQTAKITYTGNPYEGVEDDVTMGEADIYKGQKINYIFDFGDQWAFDIIVTDIDKNAPIPIKPKIIESKGKAPEQYSGW